MTDNPQILSGSNLALLDVHRDFTNSGGAVISFTEPGQSDKYIGHMRAFQSVMKDFEKERKIEFPGSVIRLPLRTRSSKSAISSKIVQVEEIQTLFEDFIREELEMSLLFLKHVCAVEIYEINAQGTKKHLAQAAIKRGQSQPLSSASGEHILVPATIQVQQNTTEWLLYQSQFPAEDSAALLSDRLGRDVQPVLEKHKLLPHVSLALSTPSLRQIEGRLFTYLPLPIQTGFKRVHVHAPFALTPSRTNLASSTEVGIVKGSDNRYDANPILLPRLALKELLVRWSNGTTFSSITISLKLGSYSSFITPRRLTCPAMSVRFGIYGLHTNLL